MAGNWFPPEYKSFSYKEGDILAFKSEGKLALERILKVDKIQVLRGQTINIQGESFTAPEDDFLLLVGTAFSEAAYDTLEQAKQAVRDRSCKVRIGHVPRRAPGVGSGATFIANVPVTADELDGYRTWKDAFDKGQAGIF